MGWNVKSLSSIKRPAIPQITHQEIDFIDKIE